MAIIVNPLVPIDDDQAGGGKRGGEEVGEGMMDGSRRATMTVDHIESTGSSRSCSSSTTEGGGEGVVVSGMEGG